MTCCPVEDLELLLAEQLPDSRREDVETHVEDCAACQGVLARLSGSLPGCHDSLESLDVAFLRRLEQPPPAVVETLSDCGAASPTTLPSIAGYEILGELGRGGMGVVYKARHSKLKRLVALKMILPGKYAGALERARFRIEAEAVARLQHPGIVSVYEVGEEDGLPYLAMELVEGGTLEARLDGTPWPPRDAAQLSEVLASATHAAHQKGIIHRDLKPSNVLLGPDGAPKISDFGLAKQLDAGATQTQSGAVLGTPSYVAPEQAAGSKEVGPQADVYSLGAILYECLTGRPPFKAATAMETLLLVQSHELVPPRQLNPTVPRELETVCLKCLNKEPHGRYPTAEALAVDLRRFLEDRPVLARRPSRLRATWKLYRRHPAVGLLGSAVVLLLVLGAVGATAAAVMLKSERDAAQAAREKAESAEVERTDELCRSLLVRANAGRASGRGGQRFEGLAALGRAAKLLREIERMTPERELELRNEAIACLALPDLRLERELRRGLPHEYWIAFDPELRHYAWADLGGGVTVTRVADGVDVAVLEGPGPKIGWMALCFSDDGGRLAVAHTFRDGTSKTVLWDFDGGGLRRPLLVPNAASAFALSRDGRLLAARAVGKGVGVYDTRTGQELLLLSQVDPVELAFRPNGRELAVTLAKSRFAVVFDCHTGQEVARYPHPQQPGSIDWRGDGRLLAVGCADQRVHVWDHVRGQPQSVLEGHHGLGIGVKFSHAGDFLLTRSWDGSLRLWDPVTGRQLVRGKGFFLGLSRDDRQLAVNPSHVLKRVDLDLYEVAPGHECRTLHHGLVGNRTERPNHWGPMAVDFSRDGTLLATGSIDGTRLWDLATWQEVAYAKAPMSCAVRFHPDGKALFTYGGAGLKLWPLRRDGQGKLLPLEASEARTLEAATTTLNAHLRLDASGRFLAAVEYRHGRVALFDAEANYRHRTIEHPGVLFALLTPDGRWLITAGTKDTRVWSTADGKPAGTFPGHFNTLSPDGRTLLGHVGDADLIRREVGTWRQLPSLRRAGSQPNGLTFAPDGKAILAFGIPRLFEAHTAAELATFEPPRDTECAVASFCRDGRLFAVATGNHSTHVWDLRAIRAGLAELGLDWDLPHPPAVPKPGAGD